MIDGMFVVDFHIHAGELEFFDRYPKYREPYFQFNQPFVTQYGADLSSVTDRPLEAKVRMLREAGVDRAVFIGLDVEPDYPFKFPVEYMAWLEKQYPDFIISFPAINPKKGMKAAIADLEETAGRGLRGVKLYPCFWGDPSEKEYYPLYEKALELGLIIMFHMGSQIAPGARLKWCRPYLLDDVAMDFPGLTIVMAHLGWPWLAEAVMGVGRKDPNVFLDTGSLTPSQHWGPGFSFTANEGLYMYIEQRIPHKLLFGSDWPNAYAGEMLGRFLTLPVSDEFKRRFLGENARAILKL